MSKAPKRRDIRKRVMQLLYQMDQSDTSFEELAELPSDSEKLTVTTAAAIPLAQQAWELRKQADEKVLELAPDWPTYRQPPVDRAILRLAYFEMASGYAPPSVVINECVELAKEFASEHSPSFINGVLDKIARNLRETGQLPDTSPNASPASSAEGWLKDAKSDDAG